MVWLPITPHCTLEISLETPPSFLQLVAACYGISRNGRLQLRIHTLITLHFDGDEKEESQIE